MEVAISIYLAITHIRESDSCFLLGEEDNLVFLVVANLRDPHNIVLLGHGMLHRAYPDNDLAVHDLNNGKMFFGGSLGGVGGHDSHFLATAGEGLGVAKNILNNIAADRTLCIVEYFFHKNLHDGAAPDTNRDEKNCRKICFFHRNSLMEKQGTRHCILNTDELYV